MPQDPDFSKHSRLSQHLALMDLADAPIAPEETADEARVIEAMVPKPLGLPSRLKSRPLWYLAPLLMAAAGVGLMLFQKPVREASPWTVKGAGHVQIFVEQDGHVQTLEEAGPLTPSARIKAEVFSEAPAVAFWGVSSQDGQLLQDPEWIAQNRMMLELQEKKFFSGSLQLDGPSEGESLCIVVCPKDMMPRLEDPAIFQEIVQTIASKALPNGNLTGCKNSCFQLRP